MCLGLATGFVKSKIHDGDKYYLDTKDDVYEYIAKATPNGIVFVPIDKSSPVGAVHESKKSKYNFKRI